MDTTTQHVFIIGAKSPGRYGGYETFVDKLTACHQNDERLKYHIACKANGQGSVDPRKIEGAVLASSQSFVYHNADFFMIRVPEFLGSAQALYYDCKALQQCVNIIKRNNISQPVVYVLACRIGPFFGKYVNAIHALGGRVYLNPDGHEWERAKWPLPVRRYWRKSEAMMITRSDLVICDSQQIEQYVKATYGNRINTLYLAYGADSEDAEHSADDRRCTEWLGSHGLKANGYYLAVGRFVAENNYETMIREFMQSRTAKDFVLITDAGGKLLRELEDRTHFSRDPRIKFVGTLYDAALLKLVRSSAYAYIHGHEVGGTNPSLVEALGSTPLSLVFDVAFNREVGQNAVLYWNKNPGNLASLIAEADGMSTQARQPFSCKAKERVRSAYNWQTISAGYAEVFMAAGDHDS